MLRHDSLLRRTTMGFAFALTAISLGAASTADGIWTVLIPIVNLVALFLFYIQDQYLSNGQDEYSSFLKSQEKEHGQDACGPYTIHACLRKRVSATDNYTFLAYLLLYAFWAIVLLILGRDQITLWSNFSIDLWGFVVLVVLIVAVSMIFIRFLPRSRPSTVE